MNSITVASLRVAGYLRLTGPGPNRQTGRADRTRQDSRSGLLDTLVACERMSEPRALPRKEKIGREVSVGQRPSLPSPQLRSYSQTCPKQERGRVRFPRSCPIPYIQYLAKLPVASHRLHRITIAQHTTAGRSYCDREAQLQKGRCYTPSYSSSCSPPISTPVVRGVSEWEDRPFASYQCSNCILSQVPRPTRRGERRRDPGK